MIYVVLNIFKYGELYHYIMLFYMAPMILHCTRFTALTLSIFICYILLLFYHRILHVIDIILYYIIFMVIVLYDMSILFS